MRHNTNHQTNTKLCNMDHIIKINIKQLVILSMVRSREGELRIRYVCIKYLAFDVLGLIKVKTNQTCIPID